MTLVTAIHPKLADNWVRENASPNTNELAAMPARLIKNSGRRPTRSISCIATSVNVILTTPTPTLARIATGAEENPANLKIVGAYWGIIDKRVTVCLEGIRAAPAGGADAYQRRLGPFVVLLDTSVR
jgi:hypothetical protein